MLTPVLYVLAWVLAGIGTHKLINRRVEDPRAGFTRNEAVACTVAEILLWPFFLVMLGCYVHYYSRHR